MVCLPAAVTNSKTQFFQLKDLLRLFNSSNESDNLPFEISEGKNKEVVINANGKDYVPAQISAMILQNIKQTAEEYLGTKVEDAVITVPDILMTLKGKPPKMLVLLLD